MSDLENPVTIEIEPEKLPSPEIADAVEKKPVDKSASPDPETVLADLKKQIEDGKAKEQAEREGRLRAEQYAQQEAQLRARAEGKAQDSELSTVLNAIEAVEAQGQAAERAYADAMSNADWTAAAKAQRAMAAAESRLLTLQNGKAAMEDRAKRGTTEGRVDAPQVTQQPRSVDPVERLASQVSPRSGDWIRKHPEVAGNVAKLSAAHNLAVLDGLTPDTDEYFQFIEDKVLKKVEPASSAIQQQERRQATVSAPVSGSPAPRTSGAGASTVTLSPAERDMARSIYPEMSAAEAEKHYATNKLALIREGKLAG